MAVLKKKWPARSASTSARSATTRAPVAAVPSVPGIGREEPCCAELPADRGEAGGRTTDLQSTLARKQQLEFTLLNHPIDCPICDKAGECTLQPY
jgi:hypothetical protein